MKLVIIINPLYQETSLLSDPLLPEASVRAKTFNQNVNEQIHQGSALLIG